MDRELFKEFDAILQRIGLDKKLQAVKPLVKNTSPENGVLLLARADRVQRLRNKIAHQSPGIDGGERGTDEDLLYSTGMAVSMRIDLDTLHRIGTALADPTRRRILVELLDGHAYPTDLAEQLGTSRANLSNHLTCLRQCGLVTATAEGRHVRYDLADPQLGEALQLLASIRLPGTCDQ